MSDCRPPVVFLGLMSFFYEDTPTTGSVTTSKADKQRLAVRPGRGAAPRALRGSAARSDWPPRAALPPAAPLSSGPVV